MTEPTQEQIEQRVDTALNTAIYLIESGFSDITADGWRTQKIEIIAGHSIVGHFVQRAEDGVILHLQATKPFIYSNPTAEDFETLKDGDPTIDVEGL